MIAKTHSVSARVCASLLAGMFVTWLGLLPAPAAAQTLSGLFSQPDAADKQELDAAGKKSGLTFCSGNFALCAAANCTATGEKIKVKGKKYPAASCECPILNGWSIADVNAGNMTGSCDPPPNGVWSMYAPLTEVPQEDTMPAWQTVAATSLTCAGAAEYAQCFSFSCVLDGTVNGQALAKCTCPIDKARKQFVTAGGNCEVSNCSADLFVGVPFPTDINACSN
jgi:hypothetical protein